MKKRFWFVLLLLVIALSVLIISPVKAETDISDVGTDFLWKYPAHNGGWVLLFPKNLIGRIAEIKICDDIACNSVLFNVPEVPPYEGHPAARFYSIKSGSVYLNVKLKDGRAIYWYIQNTYARNGWGISGYPKSAVLDCNIGQTRSQGTPCIAENMFTSGGYEILAKGACIFGTKQEECSSSYTYEWTECVARDKVTEICNGMDDDCDGIIDEDCDKDGDSYIDATKKCGGVFLENFGWSGGVSAPADFDGDGKDDLAVFCPSGCPNDKDATWYIQQSKDGFRKENFGWADVVPVPADFDGDGKADLAVYCPADCGADNPGEGWWFIMQSKDGFKTEQFGWNGPTPAPADFDGDGKAELAVYDMNNIQEKCGSGDAAWYIEGRSGVTCFGWDASIPVPGDYNGDGKAELGVYDPTDYEKSCGGNTPWYIQGKNKVTCFGWNGIKPSQGDYDGDGKTDLSVYFNGIWYISCTDCRGLINVPNNHGCLEKDLDDNNPNVARTWPCENSLDCADDTNSCTDAKCVNNKCVHVNDNTNTCDDGAWCTVNDRCSNGVCISNKKVCYEDDVSCTNAYCDETLDKCSFDTSECSCSSNSDCPDNNNPCISVKCENKICVEDYVDDSCNDNDVCTIDDECVNGRCVGTPVDIDDDNSDTYDTCLDDGTITHDSFKTGVTYDFSEESFRELGIEIIDFDISSLEAEWSERAVSSPSLKTYIKTNFWIYPAVGIIILLIFGSWVWWNFFRKKPRNLGQRITMKRRF